jgi:hypothetical protein
LSAVYEPARINVLYKVLCLKEHLKSTFCILKCTFLLVKFKKYILIKAMHFFIILNVLYLVKVKVERKALKKNVHFKLGV